MGHEIRNCNHARVIDVLAKNCGRALMALGHPVPPPLPLGGLG